MCKKHLPVSATTCYGNSAPAKSGVGFRSLQMLSATNDAPASFLLSALAHIQIMAGRMGESKDSPVSDNAGTANPVRSATPKFRSFGGGIRYPLSEAATMATVPGQLHPKFIWRFYSPRTNQRYTVIASTEAEARSRLRNSAYLFSARIRITEGVYQVRAHLHLSDGEERSFLLPDLFADHQQAENLASASGFNFSFPGHTGSVTCEVVEVFHV
ncbi:host cell division inhibitor Icd-like protein [Salmonella enterica]|uniref:host cell division inhibitor Icd-like protein n=1 Tax=Salmonella enterica TaxID=28901 RepID=UPI0009AE8C2A|nr:host cell division inhibitor Icd-like protein [Salmonella enterica]ECG3787412.1 host cell division inhibitor Icd-like protein [Salmonella enterica subsp. enterica serovar Florida]EEE8473604.1 host cell division inhibitor Icd-like protein [Salmonella enterica subsp. enterica serovar Muenchen]EAS1838174.1 host cell division inhibitor Icd-like protein [Salmonella enterica]EAS1848576.1 host cell division inhibitor Icd-like protein [Salmonella enterica]EAU0878044.1 host cell division inhibitor I